MDEDTKLQIRKLEVMIKEQGDRITLLDHQRMHEKQAFLHITEKIIRALELIPKCLKK